ncbi:MAG: hypothetical protein H6739_05660 [Alphaproteobacteria bacterium]|nr:hypothetical protein [Alphaproteobacteria bacterium]
MSRGRRSPPGTLNPGRLAAGRALMEVDRGGHLDDALGAGLPATDAALARHLAWTVARHRGQLDAAIQRTARRPVTRVDPPVRTALRVGLAELHLSRTPPHAAVDQAVRLVQALGAGHAKGFVNAVLRNGALPPDPAPTLNHPGWLVDRWTERYGPDAVAAWCRRNDAPAPLAVVCRGAPEVEGCGVRPATAAGRPVPDAWWIDDFKGAVTQLPGFEEGALWVMDPAAAAVADLLDARPGQRVLDACAAPGGKTLRLAATSAQVTAADRSPSRLERLQGSLSRTGRSATVRVVDWETDPWTPTDPFDAVLVDAPCTGLGTLRRHPEIRWNRHPTDPAAMAIRQLAILRAAARAARPGGTLVYAVCSPEPEEGPGVVSRLLQERDDLKMDAELLTAPPHADEDAHYAARLLVME